MSMAYCSVYSWFIVVVKITENAFLWCTDVSIFFFNWTTFAIILYPDHKT